MSLFEVFGVVVRYICAAMVFLQSVEWFFSSGKCAGLREVFLYSIQCKLG